MPTSTTEPNMDHSKLSITHTSGMNIKTIISTKPRTPVDGVPAESLTGVNTVLAEGEFNQVNKK